MRCSRCSNPATVKKNGKSSGYCLECKKQWARKHYEDNKKEYIARAKKRNKSAREEIRNWVNEVKARPCMDCGKQYPYYVMDLDHREGTKKKDHVARMMSWTGIKKVKEEVAKCDVVCANCHRIRTFQRAVKRRSSKGKTLVSKTENGGSIPSRRVTIQSLRKWARRGQWWPTRL